VLLDGEVPYVASVLAQAQEPMTLLSSWLQMELAHGETVASVADSSWAWPPIREVRYRAKRISGER
jgi:hypothetical protein